MEVSRVSFTEVTKAKLKNPVLSPKRRKELSRALVLEYLNSVPAGTPLATKTVLAKTGLNISREIMHHMLNGMERDGLISIEKIPNSYSRRYSVLTGAKVTKPKAVEVKKIQGTSDMSPVEVTHVRSPLLSEYAKEFAWKNNSDSLRDFVAWMDGKELELRRFGDR